MASLPPADLEAAVEPFEALTEQAFSANPEQLGKLVSEAEASFGRVEPSLTPPQRSLADRYLRTINTFDHRADRSSIALASVEIYRLLLEAQMRAADPVIAAGLLDYAGFRFGALAQADKIDWTEMSRTTRVAQFEWHKLKPSIANAALRKRFSQSLTAMAESAAKRDPIAARKAADSELELVDLLEEQIATASK